MIVNFFEASANFELSAEEAIEYFKGKGLKQSYNWYEMMGQDHYLSFTVAKMMEDDLLITVRTELDKAMADGLTMAEFKKDLIPILQRKGWWGKKDVIDAATGHVTEIQLGSASRLENIFRTNMQSSYAAGQWQGIQETKETIPFLMYDAVDDDRTREEHAKFDGLVLPVDDPFWLTHYPLNGWFCRCGVIQMDEDELADNGLTVSESPAIETYIWENPTTGQRSYIPKGVDPGFNHNAGISQKEKLEALQVEKHIKIGKLDAEAAQNAKKGAEATKAIAEATRVDVVASSDKKGKFN
jgi:SPP1 gp7 family putative phage head morphogenesis protein